ncbi:MAG: hypothetical protein V2I36_09865 [Desulfopila sp.]|jgi:hypothetical protein|nr:hypothetical protein [Desulfopila sp.]
MRKSLFFFSGIALLLLGDFFLFFTLRHKQMDLAANIGDMRLVVQELGLSDLALTTEARYTRHPAVSDPVSPFMDHPGDIEHFPSGSFLRPVK